MSPRTILLLGGGLALLAGLNAGLLKLGAWAPIAGADDGAHGLVMTFGFLGAVIALERAQALAHHRPKNAWGYLAPVLLALGGLVIAASAPDSAARTTGHFLLIEGGIVLVAVYVGLYRRAPIPLVGVQILSGVAALGAAILSLNFEVFSLIPLLGAFLIITIATERAELAQITMGPRAIPVLAVTSVLLLLAAAAALVWPPVGARFFGIIQGVIALWLLRDDVPRRLVRATGLHRFTAISLGIGYLWLLVGAAVWILTAGPAGTVYYDVVIHAIFLGFAMSMILAHAPIIFPTVTGLKIPYTPAQYISLAVMHLGLAIRVIADLTVGQRTAWIIGGTMSVVAILLFLAITIIVTIRERLRSRRASRQRAVAGPDEATQLPSEPVRPRLLNSHRVRPLRDFVALIWLAGALAAIAGRSLVPSADWLTIHLLFLGALTHSAMVWSEYFATTLLKTHHTQQEDARQDQRILLLAGGALAVLIGYPAGIWPLVVAGACAVGAAIIWHAAHLTHQLRSALPGRWRIVIRYYLTAAAMIPIGATIGAILAFGVNDEWRGRLIIAHMTFNLLGWIGLTVVGTLVTFWATMVRARMHPDTEKWARHALPILIIGIVITAGGALIGMRLLALFGVGIYATGLVWWGRSLVAPVRSRGLRELAPASVGASIIWASSCLVWLGGALATSGSWADVTDQLPRIGLYFGGAFATQILIGALSYLLPALIGGGPRVSNVVLGVINTGATIRIIIPNLALVLTLAPLPSAVRTALVALAALTLATFLPIAARASLTGAALKRERSGETVVR